VSPAQATQLRAAHADRSTYLETRGLGHSGTVGSPEVIDAVLSFLAAPGSTS
jgi:hypothetical protein